MKLSRPFFISSRLLPALKIGGVTIQLEALPRDHEGRTVYCYTLDGVPGLKKPVIGQDLKSGCQGGTVFEGFCSLLAFLNAESEEPGMFDSPAVSKWAKENADDIGMMSCQFEEAESPLICA